jgi:hypothetical protein
LIWFAQRPSKMGGAVKNKSGGSQGDLNANAQSGAH